MSSIKEKPGGLTRELFWDVDPGNIDFEKHASYVIERVLSMGTYEDFNIVKSYYGKQKMKAVAKKLRYMDDRLLYFCSAYFNLPISKFRCYTSKQLNLSHWNY
jgi:hypothetical protein